MVSAHRRAMTNVRGSSRFVAASAWFLASLLTALAAHAAIDRVGTWLVDSEPVAAAYGQHAHPAIGPIGLLASIVFAAVLLGVSARAVARRQHLDDGFEAFSQLRSTNATWAVGCVALGGSVTLVGMEFAEQLCAFGRIEGLADALGGSVPLGLALIFGVATVITATGLRFAGACAYVAAATALTIVSWIIERFVRVSLEVRAALLYARRRRPQSRRLYACCSLSCLASRAPPLSLR